MLFRSHNNQRAAYGKKVLQQLSNKLTDRFGKGWSVETLTLTRKFYLTYANPKIANTVYDFQKHSDDLPAFALSWSPICPTKNCCKPR